MESLGAAIGYNLIVGLVMLTEHVYMMLAESVSYFADDCCEMSI
jgi:hypothetical protein